MEMGSRKSDVEWVDFKEVKRQVSIGRVLDHYGIALHKSGRDSLRGKCPLPTHVHKNEQSFSVNLSKDIWACMSESCITARAGKRGGNVLDLIAVLESCSIRDAALKAKAWFDIFSVALGDSEKEKPQKEELAAEEKKEGIEPEENKPLGFELRNVDGSHIYLLQERRFKPETVNWFKAGLFTGKGSMQRRVVFPVHNERDQLIGYIGRYLGNPPDGEPKYKLPAGFKKSLVLYNLNRVLKLKVDTAIVVEGVTDALRIHEAGFKNVVALMGSALSEVQEGLLTKHFKRVVLLLDGDEAGRNSSEEILKRLSRKMFVKVIDLPNGKQPDQLSSEEIQKLLSV